MPEPVYRTVIFAARGLRATKGWKVRVSGAENIPASGPAVIAINHAGYLDFVFAAWSISIETHRYVRYMAKKEIFEHKISGPLMRAMKHIPVDRSHDPSKSLDSAITALKAGEIVGTFPEATINRSFVPGRGKTGSVRMAQAASAPLIPVAVWGAHRLLTKGRPRNFQRKVVIQVEIGQPMIAEPTDDARVVTDVLMDEIRRLLAKAQSGYPQTPKDDSDRWWLPAHLGGTAPLPESVKPRPDAPGLQ